MKCHRTSCAVTQHDRKEIRYEISHEITRYERIKIGLDKVKTARKYSPIIKFHDCRKYYE